MDFVIPFLLVAEYEETNIHCEKRSTKQKCWKSPLWFPPFLSNINNYILPSNYLYLIIIICLHTVT